MNKATEGHEPESVEEVLGDLDELAAGQDKVCIGDALDDFGGRSFGPFIMLPALLEITPVGGIPGVPTFLALIIAIVAVQLLLGKEHIWLPGFIQDRAVASNKLHKGLKKLRGIAHWLDEHSHGRLEGLTEGIWTKVAAVVVILLCCMVPPLEFLPFASSAPMLAIAAIGLALTVRDGVMMLIALLLAMAAVGGAGYLAMTYSGDEAEGSLEGVPFVTPQPMN
ncbi:exopolysaccharide biosynthesis protein [Qipengyuania sp. 1NDH17]|uniref:Exopolysaccharide biosynthesis protein n=1 Tax=Qipengyuania polymorpha TaxID=2867234 RepID=A0ABS7IZA5_9SPHN|nr:exopolysaccharide biosynthesis protein [Qipengyuania polymorpha]MBX7458399.1 exopolysaccharide biosynthesis protein [Qipengyuania polymorpha]